ncbi:MAG: phenylalanine--tRNA ligase subunit beta [Candidatus Jidaibacter sp.]|jgi:phenylalanyl-tRNA synthetase beta chain|nr:phenylalanine--tRNA ligase subunit beta [Candidatus Jidaibacter sp.]
MKFTYSWLKEYLNTNATVGQICEALTNSGLEVESVQDNGALFEPFIVAEILNAARHPDAERLQVCEVNDGSKVIQVVCGAANARAGIKVVLAPVGSIIPANQLQIKASKIRGVDSNGMLCSAEELGLADESHGIIELESNAVVGQKFSEHAGLNDVVIEIALTPNRGDAASVYGVARDLYALGLGELKALPSVKSIDAKPSIAVGIDAKEECYEFTITTVENVSNATKSLDIEAFLKLVGHNIKSPLVSISNFTMFAYGRPNHMYDLNKIKGGFIVRKSQEGEKFIPIGMDEIILPVGVLVVADDEKVLAVAGVIGGELSKVDENTKSIAIEVANFCPVEVAKSGRLLNIHTDSRFRFERRVDAANTMWFANYIADQVVKYCGGNVLGRAGAIGIMPDFVKEVDLKLDAINKMCGQELEESRVIRILEALGFTRHADKLVVPSFKFGDITGPVDIAEEVIRIHGLNNIAKQPFDLSPESVLFKQPTVGDKLRAGMTSLGFDEVITWTFVSEEQAKIFGFNNPIRVANPISSDMSVMRQTIVPMLLANAMQNGAQSIKDVSIFEVGSAYFNEDKIEKLHVAGLQSGLVNRKTFHAKERDVDYFDAKQGIEQLIIAYGLDPASFTFSKTQKIYYHPGRAAQVSLGKNVVGYCGEIHPKILKDLGVDDVVIAFELDISAMPQVRAKTAKQKLSISYLQPVSRDFAFLVDADLHVGQLIKSVKSCVPQLESVSVFDIYEGDKVKNGKKSIAINLMMRPLDETMTDAQIEEVCQKVVSFVKKEYNAELR